MPSLVKVMQVGVDDCTAGHASHEVNVKAVIIVEPDDLPDVFGGLAVRHSGRLQSGMQPCSMRDATVWGPS